MKKFLLFAYLCRCYSKISNQMNRKRNGLFYTKREEQFNAISHGVGFGMGLIVCILFFVRCYQNGDFWGAFGVCLYFFGMGGSYLASTLYHTMKHHSPWKKRLRQWDHAAIYWHIAGSFSPVTLTVLRDVGYWGWGLFCFSWLCAIAGTIVSFREMEEHSYVETVCFIVMGLSILVAFKPLFNVAPIACYWIIAEGVCYITGAVFFSIRNLRYTHSVFHIFVLGGSVCHIVALWYVLM